MTQENQPSLGEACGSAGRPESDELGGSLLDANGISLERLNAALVKLNRFSIELSHLPANADLEGFVVKELVDLADAEGAAYAEYDPVRRSLTVRRVEVVNNLMGRVLSLLGGEAVGLSAHLDDAEYRRVTADVVRVERSLHEASFGGVSRPAGAAIEALLGIDRIICIAHIVDGNLYGVSLVPMHEKKPDPPEGIIRNISVLVALALRRRLAETALRESEERFKNLSALTSEAIAIEDNGIILDANRAFAELVGCPDPDDLIGRHGLDLVPFTPESRGRIAAVLGTGTTEVYQVELQAPDGSVRWAETRGEPVIYRGRRASLVSMRDITDAKRAEESLRVSEAKYRTVVDNIQEGIMVVAAGRLLFCNSRVGEILGYTPEEVEHLEFGARLHPDDRDDALQRLSAMFEQDSLGRLFEVRLVTKSGDTRTIGAHATVVEWQEEPAVIVFVEDITERKRAEAEQEMRRELVRILDEADAASDLFARLIDRIRTRAQFDAVGIRLRDDAGDFPYVAQQGFPADFLETENTLFARDEEGRVRRDQTGEAVLDCTCGLVISGRTSLGECFTKGGSFWTNDIASLLELPEPDDPQLRPRGVCGLLGFASAAVVPIRNKEKIVGVLHLADHRKGRLTSETVARLEAVAAHIGEALVRRSAEAALGESQQRYATLVNLSPDAIVVDEGGRYAFANPAAVRLFGARSPEDLVGLQMAGRIHPAFRDLVAARALQVAGGAVSAPREIKILRLDGTPVDVEVTAARIEFDGRWANQVVYRDISARKEAEERQHELERQLREREKLESLGFLAGGIAHDFNNMLTAIIGYSDLILAGGDDFADTTLADVGEIKDAAERAKDLTGQILAFSRRQPRETRILGLNSLVAELETLLRRTLGEHIDMIVDLPEEDCRVEMDPNQLTQVIMNLVVNARDAMPAGGTLTLQVACARPGERNERVSAVLGPGDGVVLRVTDSGVGIDPATLPHIFEPFFTTKLPGEGTGLGLSTTYGIVTQNGGEIVVSSEVGRGSTFEVYLPGVPAGSEPGGDRHAHRPEDGAAAAWRAAGRTILVVEDEPAVRKLATRLLTEQGYRVVVAADGPRALSLARDPSLTVDLLLTDVVLPGVLQGNEVATTLLRERPGLGVVFMSGYPRDFMPDSGRRDEGINYIDKPFTADSLLAKVRDALLQAGAREPNRD